MEQNTKYFTKTADALKNLHQTADLLSQNADETASNSARLQTQIASLRQEIHKKATRIDSIITKLQGAIK